MASADPGMVAQPYADPGYSMPNVDYGNLNQSPGQSVGGWLPVNALQAVNPTYGGNMPEPLSKLDQWLAEQRAQNMQRQPQ